ncbi:MAG TPA: ferritin-like fold-containing protein [Micromonosporaceae bacterium]|nr:ferritin-like fold-containing protein [Micromonosporaceae bacterium]
MRETPVTSPNSAPQHTSEVTTAQPAIEAVVELLGVLAYGHLVAFDTMAADARLAPDLTRRAMLCEMAASEIAHYRALATRLREFGADPEQAMRPYVAPITAYHRQTQPTDWLEGLVKAYVGDSIADDFFREVAQMLTSPDRELVLDVLHDTQYTDFAEKEVKQAIQQDPKLANRLALWARRLVGEALTQAQQVAAEQDELTALVVEGSGDLAGFGALMRRLTVAHSARMTAIGLNN